MILRKRKVTSRKTREKLDLYVETYFACVSGSAGNEELIKFVSEFGETTKRAA